MKVLVYVEGPSDRTALPALLRPLLDEARTRRVGVSFLPLKGKAAILNDGPGKAASHLAEHPEDAVVLLPDLYPMAVFHGTQNAHRSYAELEGLLRRRFGEAAREFRLGAQVQERFRVHCLKHDLEALVLASPDPLRRRLETSDQLRGQWRTRVEDQNDGHPPKRVVEALFERYRRRKYDDTVDAPWILERSSLAAVEAACPERFAAFVADLRGLVGGRPE